jgi:hypothetical protein
MDTLKIYISVTEQLRDEIISSLVSNRWDTINDLLTTLFKSISALPLENDQKAINQALHCYKYFRDKIPGDIRGVSDKIFKKIRTELSKIVRNEIKNPKTVSFEEWLLKIDLSEKQLKIVMKNLSSLQITTGCSNFCRRCNEWALPFPRGHFTYDAVKKFLILLKGVNNNNFSLYCASDPLDWNSNGKDISDIDQLMKDMGFSSEYGILTKIPPGKDFVFEKLIKKNADIGISITNKNRDRVKKLSEKLGIDFFKQHDLDELTIDSGFDENFSSIKPSITDSYGIEITIDGIFQIIPTFTSALSLTGQARIPVTSRTDLFIGQKTGRLALPVQYFKPLSFYNSHEKKTTLPYLLDPQIENIILDRALDDSDPPGMMNIREYFKTFTCEAVSRRKKLLPSVLNDLKKKYPENSEDFKRYKGYYLKTCDPVEVPELKTDSFIFLLKEINRYILNNPVRRGIAYHLRKDEITLNSDRYKEIFPKTIDEVIKNSKYDPFILFQILLLELIENPTNTVVENFINRRVVNYNPNADLFIRESL